MPELVKLPLTSTEYQARFSRPEIGFIGEDRTRAVKAIVTALLPFGFRLGNSEVVVNGPLSEHKVIFKLPEKGITIQFGAEYFQFTKEGSNWQTAKADAEILIAAQEALTKVTTVEIGFCLITVALHAQLLGTTREDLLQPFIPAPFQGWRKAISYGNHLRWNDGDLLLDFSAAFANGIFIKYSCGFERQQSVDTMLIQLRENERSIFQLLGIQEKDDE